MTELSINWQPTNLASEIVELIPLCEVHFEELYKVASDPLIWEQHPSTDRYKPAEFREFFEYAMEGKCSFVIFDKATDRIIGSTRFYKFDPGNSAVFIGYTFLGRSCWGGFYNKEVKHLMLDFAFRQVDKVYLHIGASNIRSQRATERFGAKKVNEFTTGQNGSSTLKFEYLIEKKDWKKSN